MALDLQAVGHEVSPFEQAYDWRDVALYALAVGAGTEDLDYLLDPDPKVLPTWGVIPAFEPVFAALSATGGNPLTLLHSGQRTELLRPFPPRGTMQTTARVQGIWDLRVGALVSIETRTAVDGEPTARTQWQLLLQGEGGFKGERPPPLLRTRPPKGAQPDFSEGFPTAPTQALLYRLTGDINPIHARPEVAREAGLDQPILHGLCSYGAAGRLALKHLAGDDPGRFRALEARFTKPVLPGQSLRVDGYLLEPGRAALTVTVEETGELVIANALFEYEV